MNANAEMASAPIDPVAQSPLGLSVVINTASQLDFQSVLERLGGFMQVADLAAEVCRQSFKRSPAQVFLRLLTVPRGRVRRRQCLALQPCASTITLGGVNNSPRILGPSTLALCHIQITQNILRLRLPRRSLLSHLGRLYY